MDKISFPLVLVAVVSIWNLPVSLGKEQLDISFMINAICNENEQCKTCMSKIKVSCDHKRYFFITLVSTFRSCYDTHKRKMTKHAKLCYDLIQLNKVVTMESLLKKIPDFNQKCKAPNQLKYKSILKENLFASMLQTEGLFICLVMVSEEAMSSSPETGPSVIPNCKGLETEISERMLDGNDKYQTRRGPRLNTEAKSEKSKADLSNHHLSPYNQVPPPYYESGPLNRAPVYPSAPELPEYHRYPHVSQENIHSFPFNPYVHSGGNDPHPPYPSAPKAPQHQLNRYVHQQPPYPLHSFSSEYHQTPNYPQKHPSASPNYPSAPLGPPYHASAPSAPPYHASAPSAPPYHASAPSAPPYHASAPSAPPYHASAPPMPPNYASHLPPPPKYSPPRPPPPKFAQAGPLPSKPAPAPSVAPQRIISQPPQDKALSVNPSKTHSQSAETLSPRVKKNMEKSAEKHKEESKFTSKERPKVKGDKKTVKGHTVSSEKEPAESGEQSAEEEGKGCASALFITAVSAYRNNKYFAQVKKTSAVPKT